MISKRANPGANGFSRPGGWRLAAVGAVGALVVVGGIWWTVRERPVDDRDGPQGRDRSSRADRTGREGRDTASRLGRAGDIDLPDLAEMFAKSEVPQLSRRQIDAYLEKTGRTTRGLLAAAQLIDAPDLLEEAAQREPNNPYVLLALALDSRHAANRGAVLEALASVAPTNSLADYLIAAREFAAGRTAEALAALERATEKPVYNTYHIVTRLDTAAIYHSAGYSPSAARLASSFSQSGAVPSALAALGPHLGRAVTAAVAAGRHDDALAFAQIGLRLSERLRIGGNLVQQAMAGGPERAVLSALPRDLAPQPGGPSAGELLAQSDDRAREMDELKAFMMRLRDMPSADQEAFFEVAWRSGEVQAARQFRDQPPQDHAGP